MANGNMVALGARVPEDLKNEIADYCNKNGVKMQFFVTQALREKIHDVIDTMMDNKLADERLRNPQFVGFSEFEKMVAARKKKA